VKAIVLDAEWEPRNGAAISAHDKARKWAPNANLAWRNPHMHLETVENPGAPGPGELIVRIDACGICGSDVHMYETDDAGYMILPYHVACPVVIGHEFAGTVVAVGEGVTAFHEGSLVTAEEIQYCGTCRACRGGYPNSCERIEDIGFTIDGGFAEYVRVPARAAWSLDPLLQRYQTPESAVEVGAMCEPVSVTYEGMFTRAGGFKPGGAVAVFGAGPIGLAGVALAAAAGAGAVICVETVPERRALAERLGATHLVDPAATDPIGAIDEMTRGQGLAMAVEASGAWGHVIPLIDRALGVGGKAVIVGMDPVSPAVDLISYQLKAASVFGSVGHCGGWNFPSVINLMAMGRIQMEHAITRRAKLDEMVDAVRSMRSRTDGKVLVKPGLE
jgi:threonine dehydrogenase-like Zn-dependent dehydrogenase